VTGIFRYIRRADADALGGSPSERYSEKLLRRGEGGIGSAVAYIRTPPGGGSPEGTHTHEFDQIFYVLDGTMTVEVEGERMIAGPGSLVVFPAGTRHANWNETDAATVHLSFGAPVQQT
jgi:quercetin dioxygenase-like cupin family protein